MKRPIFILLIFLLLAALLPASGLAAAEDARVFAVNLRNQGDQQVDLVLVAQDGPGVYRLSVAAGDERTYTVLEGMYDQVTYACGEAATGTLDVSQQLRLTFTPCTGPAANAGAPSMEKIHLSDTPSGLSWRYQYGPAGGAFGGGSGGGMAAGPCDYTATAEVTIYSRPSTSASVFSTQGAGFTIQPTARTDNGWYGFDPAVAQAANFGSFRLRWLPPHSGTLSGGCTSLPVVWAPLPGLCYEMPMGPAPVYSAPDTTSSVVWTLQVNQFAAILGFDPSGDFARVDLAPGNTGSNLEGWIEASALNMNGPCSGLPTISP